LEDDFMKNVSTLFLAALCALPGNLAVAQSLTPETPRQQLKGHLTTEMLATPLLRRVPPATQLTLSVGLAINDVDYLADTAKQIADPSSPSYQKYLTPEQFAEKFGATAADYQTVLDWAQANHLGVTAHKNRFVADVTGSVADIETALAVHLNYRQRPDGTEFFAPDAEPSVKLAVPVEHISGLQNFVPPQSAGGSGSGGNYQGNDFRNAYAPNMTLTGAGQKIGIFMLDGFAQSDINGYATLIGETFLPVQVVPTSATLTPGVEGTLDIEMAYSMAPAAQVVAFVGTSNRTQMLTNMTDREDIKQFSSSWFWYDGTTTDTNLMLQLATQGQSFFQATGDGGAYQVGVFPTYVSGSLDCRQFPSITMVGGTSLHMTNSGASYGTLETAWSGSSGGIESSVAIPSFQWGIAGDNGASASNRNVPDVAAQAAGGTIYESGKVQYWGGTSQATPLWAGFMALTNELKANFFGSSSSVGFANPALYNLASTSAYATSFHDVVSGCTPDKSGNSYCSGKGYDLTTGLGSPQHTLIYELSGVQSYPLYCKGPLVTTGTSTPFKWASQGAGAASPGAGECAWADRGPQGTEIQSGNSNVIEGALKQVANLPAGKYAEIGVYNDPTGNHMVVTQIVGLVTPPFSANPVLP
jgi:subtilase family serine protease